MLTSVLGSSVCLDAQEHAAGVKALKVVEWVVMAAGQKALKVYRQQAVVMFTTAAKPWRRRLSL